MQLLRGLKRDPRQQTLVDLIRVSPQRIHCLPCRFLDWHTKPAGRRCFPMIPTDSLSHACVNYGATEEHPILQDSADRDARSARGLSARQLAPDHSTSRPRPETVFLKVKWSEWSAIWADSANLVRSDFWERPVGMCLQHVSAICFRKHCAASSVFLTAIREGIRSVRFRCMSSAARSRRGPINQSGAYRMLVKTRRPRALPAGSACG